MADLGCSPLSKENIEADFDATLVESIYFLQQYFTRIFLSANIYDVVVKTALKIEGANAAVQTAPKVTDI